MKVLLPSLSCLSPLLLSPRMAEINNKTNHESSKSRNTPSFLRCFGFSRKIPNKKIGSFSETVQSEDAKKKKKACWFSWSRLGLKNSTIKTVLVDTTTTVSEKPTIISPPDSEVQMSKSKSDKAKLITCEPQVPTEQYSQTPSEIEVVIDANPDQALNIGEPLEVQVPTEQYSQTPSEIEVVIDANPDQAPNIGEPLEIRYSPVDKHSGLRRLNSSIHDNDNSNNNNNNSPKSSPSPPKLTSENGVGTVSTKKIKSDPRKNVGPTIKYDWDWVVGMSEIMVTLVILLLFGRLCAILCTSAWFYFVLRLHSAMVNDERALLGTTPTKYGSLVGMSLIMVTLVILLLFGRLCAILCTSAWFYFVLRLRSTMVNDDLVLLMTSLTKTAKTKNAEAVDFNSIEYKKKVVLEGFLERTGRSPP